MMEFAPKYNSNEEYMHVKGKYLQDRRAQFKLTAFHIFGERSSIHIHIIMTERRI